MNFSDVTDIAAGKPYIVKWEKPDTYTAFDGTNATTCSDIVNPVFKNVTVNRMAGGTQTDYVVFWGIFDPMEISSDWAESKSLLYMGSDNKLYYPAKTITIKACRAFFYLVGITAGDLPAGARAFVLNFGDEETTPITNLPSPFTLHPSQKEAWYTLDGRRLNGKPMMKGLYMKNGKKVIIK